MSGVSRLLGALAGEVAAPPVAGLSFVPPAVMPGLRHDPSADAALALARTCDEASLDFAFVPAWEPWAPRAAELLRERGIAVLFVVEGVLWPALRRVGVDEGLRLSAAGARGGEAASVLERAMDDALAASIERLDAGVRDGCDAIVVADDLAGATGPLVSPAFARSEVLPRLGRLASRAHSAGVPAILHCDGDPRTLAGDISVAGFVAVHGDCGGAGRVSAVLAALRDEGLVLVGGIPTAELSSPVRALRAGAEAAVLARAGGLLVADDGGITTTAEFASLISALAVVATSRTGVKRAARHADE